MKTALALTLIALAALAGGCGSSAQESAPPASASSLPERLRNVLFGHIESMTRSGGDFELTFDPAWWLNRLLTFVVRPDAHVTVVTHGAGGTDSVAVSAAELAEIVNGRNPKHRPLFSAKLPFWISVGEQYPNPAVEIDQQYQP